ncbi:TetR/AcrR family transcriptional regulator [Lactiplantibacillus sp. WILCCON 0030]|uniref:TetR/AcrR family transcriptional regulator n=1 Tax=Lactiplantibacillus brownii TaxID=3069269 RepID=A0ABU1A8R0_9LACO|nr:TetR/AcrR family transcriptional regulator [Lactiplantibacillus brownii]MDQ7936832.1 TetR/AcrR family transcriptional regulator [Lactiplantibacillus brownii]
MVTRAEQLAKTHQAILDAARTLFLKHGYAATSTRDIANAIGITQPALYHHFKDKEVIFLAVITTVGGEIKTGLDQILSQPNQVPLEQLTDVSLLLTHKHPADIFTLIHTSFKDLSREHIGQLAGIFRNDYVQPLQVFFAQPNIQLQAGVTPAMAANFYLTSLSPLFNSFHRIGDPDADERTQIQTLLKMIMFGVATAPTTH